MAGARERFAIKAKEELIRVDEEQRRAHELLAALAVCAK